jgi:hypothetical protein
VPLICGRGRKKIPRGQVEDHGPGVLPHARIYRSARLREAAKFGEPPQRELRRAGGMRRSSGEVDVVGTTSVWGLGRETSEEVDVRNRDRVVAALVHDGTVHRGGNGYRLGDDGLASKPKKSHTESGIFVYCARCGGSHPKPDKGGGEPFEDVHRRAIAS